MKKQLKWMSLAIANAALISLAGCGGGGGGDAAPSGGAPVDSTPVVTTSPTVVVTTPPAPTTTAVTTTVIDGALDKATVCMDKNSNGVCDAGEVQGKTDALGKITLMVPNADVGKFPLLAMVGTDAVDADNGPVRVPYTMVAPAARSAVISPLTTMCQQVATSTGVSIDEAERAVQSSTGITAPLFADFTKAPAPTDGSPSAMAVARMIVVATQAQATNLASTVGAPAMDGAIITQADITRAVNQRLLEILPALVAALSNPANASLTGTAKEAAVVAAITRSLVTTASVPTLVAINNQQTTTANAATPTGTVTAAPPAAFVQLVNLNFTDATNWFGRIFTGSVAQNTPDANNNTRFVDRRYRSNNGAVAQWNFANNPQDQAIVHYTGSAWEACGLNFESTSTVRDALGNNSSNYCNNYSTSKSNRTSFNIAGKTMAKVYDDARAAGFTNLTIANSATVLGSTTFPAGSTLGYQTTTPQTQAIGYNPRTNDELKQYSAAVHSGGAQPTGVGCNSNAFSGPAELQTTSLEMMVAAFKGSPCILTGSVPPSFVVNGTTFTSPVLRNEAWGAAALGLGIEPAASGTPTAFFADITRVRVAFTGTGTNPITYYACKVRANNNSTRNCDVIGNGSYTIATLGDARVMTLSNPPAQAASSTFNRVFVERGGKVYFGFQEKLTVTKSARLNTIASNALLAKLGAAVNPEVPLALTAASYQGTWFVKGTTSTGAGLNLLVGANGVNSCQDAGTFANDACTLTVTNPATGAFTADFTDGGQLLGTLNFFTGAASGTFTEPGGTPASGTFTGARR
jgi:trimeric autotransporter adhesin